MNSRVSSSIEGMDPSVREQAEAAARRAGMSLSEWLNANVGNYPAGSSAQGTPDVSDIHQRLDSLTRQIDQISRPVSGSSDSRAEAPRAEPPVARQ